MRPSFGLFDGPAAETAPSEDKDVSVTSLCISWVPVGGPYLTAVQEPEKRLKGLVHRGLL